MHWPISNSYRSYTHSHNRRQSGNHMSDIRANTISDASGNGPINLHKQSAAKAWINFDGTGATVVRNSLNVSGLVDNGVGAFTVNLTNNFSAGDYAILFQADRGGSAGILAIHLPGSQAGLSASSFNGDTYIGMAYPLSPTDHDGNYATAHGDLA